MKVINESLSVKVNTYWDNINPTPCNKFEKNFAY